MFMGKIEHPTGPGTGSVTGLRLQLEQRDDDLAANRELVTGLSTVGRPAGNLRAGRG
jgi:hypothetical protein